MRKCIYLIDEIVINTTKSCFFIRKIGLVGRINNQKIHKYIINVNEYLKMFSLPKFTAILICIVYVLLLLS